MAGVERSGGPSGTRNPLGIRKETKSSILGQRGPASVGMNKQTLTELKLYTEDRNVNRSRLFVYISANGQINIKPELLAV